MRFMLLLTPDGAGEASTPADIARWTAYNAELLRAGVLLASGRLQPVSPDMRIILPGGRAGATRVGATGTCPAIVGYWMIQVRSAEEAIEWASRCPTSALQSIEVRRVHDGAPHARGPAG